MCAMVDGPQRLTRLIRIALGERSPSRFRAPRSSSSTSSTTSPSRARTPSSHRRSRWLLRLAALKRRASAAGVPSIYINDNFGQWRSDFRRTVAHCTARSSPGRRRVAAAAADRARLLRAEAQALGVLRHDARHAARGAADPPRHPDRHRRQHLRPLHRERRLHARLQDSSRRPTASSRTPQPTTTTRCARFRRC